MASLLLDPQKSAVEGERELEELYAMTINWDEFHAMPQFIQPQSTYLPLDPLANFPYQLPPNIFIDPNLFLGEHPFFDFTAFSDSPVMPLDDTIANQFIQQPDTAPALLDEVGNQKTQQVFPEPPQQECSTESISTEREPQAKARKPREKKRRRIFKLKKAPHRPIRGLLGPHEVVISRRLLDLGARGTMLSDSSRIEEFDAWHALQSIKRAIPWPGITGDVPDAKFLDAVYQGNTIYAVPDVDIRPLFRNV